MRGKSDGPRSCGFTLVEILIVVVILGILAALVVPNVSRATDDVQTGTTSSELGKLQRAIEVYQARNEASLPPLEGDGIPVLVNAGEYLQRIPSNPWIGGEAGQRIVAGTGPDEAYHQEYGWIYDPETGDVWAAGFDAEGLPLPKQ